MATFFSGTAYNLLWIANLTAAGATSCRGRGRKGHRRVAATQPTIRIALKTMIPGKSHHEKSNRRHASQQIKPFCIGLLTNFHWPNFAMCFLIQYPRLSHFGKNNRCFLREQFGGGQQPCFFGGGHCSRVKPPARVCWPSERHCCAGRNDVSGVRLMLVLGGDMKHHCALAPAGEVLH